MQLQSTRVSLDDEYAVMQYFWEQGWTDGLPIVAPTPDRVEALLAAAGLGPEATVGAYQTRATALTAEKLAVNAVMAGCKPEYMPVLVAAFEGLTDPAYRMNHMASLGSPWPLIIVNGPIVKEIGMTSGQYVMGGGNHANATIGRAVSLAMANCFGAKVGGVQRGCLGNPNRWSFCIAENEDTPWTPLHAQRGFPGRGERRHRLRLDERLRSVRHAELQRAGRSSASSWRSASPTASSPWAPTSW